MKHLIVLAAALLCACGGSPAQTGIIPDSGVSAVADSGPAWSTAAFIDSSSGAGLDLVAATDGNGNLTVAYFRQDPNVFVATCNADAGCPQYALMVARETSPGTWNTEQVPAALDGGELNGHVGLTLAFDPSGNPAVAYQGGDSSDNDPSFPDDRYHDFLTGARLPSDLVIARKSGSTWTKTTLATSSNSIAADFAVTNSNIDDHGPVAGAWAGLIFDADGSFHVIHRDMHFAAAAGDFDASNLEWAHFRGTAMETGEIVTSRIFPLAPVSQDIHGGGTYSHLVLASGEPAISFGLGLTTTDDLSQVWFAQRTGANAWTRTMVSDVTGRVGHGPSLAYSTTQGFAIGFLDATQGDLLVATSATGATWPAANTVEALGETGYHPAVAWSGPGSGASLGILYAFCHGPTYSGTAPCDPVAKQLRFRVPGANGPLSVWSAPELVDPSVPDSTALIADATGKFVAIWRDPAGGLKFSRRTP
jgi:hypothetical protein